MKNQLSFKQYVWQFATIYKLYISLLIFIAVLAGIFEISVDYKIKEIIDSISLSGGNDIEYFLAFFVIYKLLYHSVFFVQRLLDIKYKPKILEHVVKDIYRKTVEHSLHWFDSHLSGDISSKISDFQMLLSRLLDACLE